MSDLETRLTAALTEGAAGAPPGVGLAVAARSRARGRRRAKMAGVAVLAALCIGVPTAVVALGGSDDGRPPKVAEDTTPAPAVPAGMRVESWRGVTALVPDSWGYGSLQDWCANGGSLTPRVERPGTLALHIGCPSSTYGLSFQELPPGQDRDQVFDWPVALQTSGGWPPNAYVGAHGIGDVLVQVTMPSEQEALAVLATVRALGPEGDSNGCPLDPQTAPRVPEGAMSICRYDEHGQLEQSERLTGDDVASAENALEGAPTGTATSCAPIDQFRSVIRMVSANEDADVDLACGQLMTASAMRHLTADVLYWALSPGWSGSVPEGVSLPSVLRSP